MIKIKLNIPFNLENTITCGQIFRFFKQSDGSYDVILKDRVINIYQNEDELFVSSNIEKNLENVVKTYLDINNNYSYIDDYLIKKDKKIKDAVIFSKGLTMIKQDPFETIIAYIISANNGVFQIANALNNISKKYGKKVNFNNKEYYLFPSYKDLKEVSKEEYRNCKVGFRDKYIKEFVDKVNNSSINLDSYYKIDTKDALESLMNNNGIGPKVASCILLFAYQKYDVFPVDTWVKKIMKNNYNIEGEKNIREFAKNKYGKYSGIAIQYLFNYSRNK